MTDTGYFGYSGNTGDDLVLEEDAPTVDWVDRTLSEAEEGGFLGELAEEVDAGNYMSPDEYAALMDRARGGSSGERGETGALTREEIRERIFAKLRRPDGAPFAAGYATGPAARLPMYEGEDTQTGWRSRNAPTTDVMTTEYESRDTLAGRANRSDPAGRILDAQGRPVPDGLWGWVLDSETGYLLLFDADAAVVISSDGTERPKRSNELLLDLLAAGYKIRATHHTTPVAGMPVTGAGLLRVTSGFVTELSDESGHYRPEAPQQYAALQALMNDGYSLEQAKVKLTGRSMGPRPTDKADWLDEASEDNANFPTGDITLRPEQFMQTQGDEYQIRAKMALNDEIRARGETPATTEGWGGGQSPESNYQTLDDLDPYGSDESDDDLSDDSDDDLSDEDDDGIMQFGVGPGQRRIPDPNRPGYTIVVDDVPDHSYQTMTPRTDGDHYQTMTPRTDVEGDVSEEDPDAAFLEGARSYLAGAGRSAFAEWFRTLSSDHQDLLLADPEIGTAWRAENAPPPPAWQPAETDYVSAASANETFIDDLADRGSGVFELGGFSLLIGDGHDARHVQFVSGATDHVTGTVTVRKAALGRGAGSLTFTRVPPAKQEVVRRAVARFSRKEVRFER